MTQQLTLTIDPSLRARMESIRISPRRLFWCSSCCVDRNRDGVNKDGRGGYVCLWCSKPIEKITDAVEKGF